MSASDARLQSCYDVFISHNHADKEWVRELARRLADHEFNGRALRPWLDEHFLDPGELGQRAELTTAIDRSRTFALVLSPASAASAWVEYELEYFLQARGTAGIIPILESPCPLPPALAGVDVLDFTRPGEFEEGLAALLARLCPSRGPGLEEASRPLDEAWQRAVDADPGGLSPGPTPPRDALLAELTRHDVDDAAGEGLAIAAFVRAAGHLRRINDANTDAGYNLKMLLGECLAVAILASPRYRQAAQRLIDMEDPAAEDPVLAFVVVRAFSKLADIDSRLIDTSALLRLTCALDGGLRVGHRKLALAMLVGRLAARLRGTDLGDLFIRTLSEGGTAARIAAIGGITMGEERAPPVFHVSVLETMHRDRGGSLASGASQAPSRRLQALLFGLELDQDAVVGRQLGNAREDLRRDFGIEDLPYGHTWLALRQLPAAQHLHNAPFMGTLVTVDTTTMERTAVGLDATRVACLTEARIVDALFDDCGALLIRSQSADSPQCRRLRSRGVPFAMLDEKAMAELSDGDQIVVQADGVKLVRQA